jgi:hypothetical protein
VHERRCILDCILTSTGTHMHMHTHPLIDSIIRNVIVSIPRIQTLSPAKEYGQGTISISMGKKRGWATAWGGNGVAVQGRTWFLRHKQIRMDLCLLIRAGWR